MDPVNSEGLAARGTLLLAGIPALGTVTNLWQSGSVTTKEALQVRRLILSKITD